MDSNILRDVLKLVFENNKKDSQHCHGYWTERVQRGFVLSLFVVKIPLQMDYFGIRAGRLKALKN